MQDFCLCFRLGSGDADFVTLVCLFLGSGAPDLVTSEYFGDEIQG